MATAAKTSSAKTAKKEKKSPPKMKKMVVKSAATPIQEEIFENDSKDFAFAFAEAMMREQLAADEKLMKEAESKSVKLTKRPTTRTKGENTLKFSNADLLQLLQVIGSIFCGKIGKHQRCIYCSFHYNSPPFIQTPACRWPWR